MQQRHLRLNDGTQAGSPFPWVSNQGEPVQNNPPRSRTYSGFRSGLGVARSAYVARFGYAPHELTNSGYYTIWPPNLTDLTPYNNITSAINGATAADIGTRKMFGHFHQHGQSVPNPNSWPLSGSSTSEVEYHSYPNGIQNGHHEVVDQDTRAGFQDPINLYNPAATNLNATHTRENSHTFSVITDNNLVFHVQEAYSVDWLDASNSVVATFNVLWDLNCDTDDANFPNYTGPGTINRVMPGRSISNARFAADYFAALQSTYANHGAQHDWPNINADPNLGGDGYNLAQYIDGYIFLGPPNVTTIYSKPQLAAAPEYFATLMDLSGGAFGTIVPDIGGHINAPYVDEMIQVGYDLRVQRGTYTLTQWVFDLTNAYVSGPTTTTLNSDSWWIPIYCEADNTVTLWIPAAGSPPGVDYQRLDVSGSCPRPPPSGETQAVANFIAPDLAFL